MEIQFIKCHGSGNDFVLIDEVRNGPLFSNESDRSAFAIALSDRNGLVGSDGVLFLGTSDICDYSMRMFNTDGSEAEMCGNGIRCLGRLASEKSGKESFYIEVQGKSFFMKKEKPLGAGVATYSVKIEDVIFDPARLPMITDKQQFIDELIPVISDQLNFTATGMPNPHLVSFIDGMDEASMDEELISLGNKIIAEKPTFPNGFNVSLSKEILPGRIFTRTYERGVGLTNACGTAMCASAVTYTLMEHEQVNRWIDVVNKGGMVKCLVEKSGNRTDVTLLGNATFVYSASLSYSPSNGKIDSINNRREHSEENQAYETLLEELRSIH